MYIYIYITQAAIMQTCFSCSQASPRQWVHADCRLFCGRPSGYRLLTRFYCYRCVELLVTCPLCSDWSCAADYDDIQYLFGTCRRRPPPPKRLAPGLPLGPGDLHRNLPAENIPTWLRHRFPLGSAAAVPFQPG